MSKGDVTAADILAALDRAVLEAREQAKTKLAVGAHEDAEFASIAGESLSAFRELLRSQDFMLQCQREKGKKTT